MASHLEVTEGCLLYLVPPLVTNGVIYPADTTGTRLSDLRMSLMHILDSNPSPREVDRQCLHERTFGNQTMVHVELEGCGLKSHYMVQLTVKTEVYLCLI